MDAMRVFEHLDRPIDLVLTELDAKGAAALAESLGAVRALTLQKPYSPERLRQAVRSVLDATE
jgi:CheY-like chemotaxis protein